MSLLMIIILINDISDLMAFCGQGIKGGLCHCRLCQLLASLMAGWDWILDQNPLRHSMMLWKLLKLSSGMDQWECLSLTSLRLEQRYARIFVWYSFLYFAFLGFNIFFIITVCIYQVFLVRHNVCIGMLTSSSNLNLPYTDLHCL